MTLTSWVGRDSARLRTPLMEAEMTRSSQLCKRRFRAKSSQWREEQVQMTWGKKEFALPKE